MIKTLKVIPLTLFLLNAPLSANEEVSENNYPTIKLNTSIMLDHDAFEEGFLENSDEGDNHGEIRRARLGVSSQLSENWNAKFKVDVSGHVEIKDAYIAFTGWKWADITVGKQKEAFGLEKQMSSRNLLMIERSMVSEALSLGRTNGAKLSGEYNNVNWQVGYFQDDNAEKSNAVTGRIAWAPLHKKNHLVHLGLSFSERSLHNEAFRINESMEVHTADSNLEGKKLTADNASLLGSELIWKYKAFTTMAEWQMADIENDTGKTYGYEGGYVQMSYLLTGGKRKYKHGMLGGVNADKDWEATMRYSQFYLKEESTKAKTFSIGVNYHYNKDFKFMANYIHADHTDDGLNLDSSNALSFRIQYRF